jgi:hypothetical protein
MCVKFELEDDSCTYGGFNMLMLERSFAPKA